MSDLTLSVVLHANPIVALVSVTSNRAIALILITRQRIRIKVDVRLVLRLRRHKLKITRNRLACAVLR